MVAVGEVQSEEELSLVAAQRESKLTMLNQETTVAWHPIWFAKIQTNNKTLEREPTRP